MSKKLGIDSYWHMPNAINSLLGKAYFNTLIKTYS